MHSEYGLLPQCVWINLPHLTLLMVMVISQKKTRTNSKPYTVPSLNNTPKLSPSPPMTQSNTLFHHQHTLPFTLPVPKLHIYLEQVNVLTNIIGILMTAPRWIQMVGLQSFCMMLCRMLYSTYMYFTSLLLALEFFDWPLLCICFMVIALRFTDCK